MKRFCWIVTLFFSVVFSTVADGIGTHWRPIDPVFDSIVSRLETNFVSDGGACCRDTMINRLYAIADMHDKEPVYRWRSQFWDARSQLKKNNPDSAVVLIEQAYHRVDTVHYPYDYMRIFHLRTVLRKDTKASTYKHLKEVSGYYAKVNDRFMLAHVYIDMGNILTDLKDYSKALEYLRAADVYYDALNEYTYRAKNRLNLSNVLYLMEEKDEADEILTELLHNTACIKDTAFYITTLLSLTEHSLFEDDRYISEAYRLAIPFANKGLLMQSECFMGNYYRTVNMPDSALYYYRKACRRADERYIDILVPVQKYMAESFFAIHEVDSAYLYLNRYEQVRDSLNRVNNWVEIARIESRASIEKHELELRQAEERARFRLILILFVCALVVFIAVFICYIFWKRQRDEKMKKQLKELENKDLAMRLENETLQKNRFKSDLASKDRELASNSLIIMEKNQVLKSLADEIERAKEQGMVHPGTAAQIGNNIKVHLGMNDEWEFFKMQFVKVHPDFFVRLKALAPSVTEGELRLCAYIRTGMENKQIAQMLSLQPDSIKKNRYRLRQKLNIAGKESLETFLRNI